MSIKKEKIKMFKKLLCFSATFILILTSFCIPSFADSFVLVPAADQWYVNTLKTNGLSTGYNTADRDRKIGVTPSTFVAYPFYVSGSTYYSLYIATSISSFSTSTTKQLLFTGGSWGDSVGKVNVSPQFDSTSNLYYQKVGNNDVLISTANSKINVYSSVTEGLTAISNFINNPPSDDPVYDDLPDFYIQRGYAAYIDFGSDWSSRSCSGTFTSTFPQYSSLISGDWDGTDNRRYFWTDSLPSNTSFSSNVGNAIDWTKVAPYDLLQRSKNGIWFIQSNSPQNRYLVIVNPNQWRYGQIPTEDTLNSSIKVSDLSGSTGDVKFLALNQQFDQNGTLVSSASDNASNNRTGTYDPNTDTWSTTDSSGNAADQVPGGMSDSPPITSIGDYISSITSILTNFANSVISLIQAPISHVTELIDAGSGFMSALRGLYSWLPVDIQGLVISALTVVIGIGVFKVFL